MDQDNKQPASDHKDDILPLDFNRQKEKSKFPGNPVPDSAEIARMMMQRAAESAETAKEAEMMTLVDSTALDMPSQMIAAEQPAAPEKKAAPVQPMVSPAPPVARKTAMPESNLLERAANTVPMTATMSSAPDLSTAEVEIPESETATSWLIKRKKKVAGVKFTETVSLGKILQDARVSSGLTLKEVEAETRIRASYLESLEHDRFSELPPPVYVRAYIRNLSNLFNLDKKMLEEILLHHYNDKPAGGVISEEIYHKLEKDKQTNVEDEARIKRMILLVAIGATALLALIIGSIFFMVSSARRPKVQAPAPVEVVAGTAANKSAATTGNGFAADKIEQLTVNQELEMGVLPTRDAAPAPERVKTSGTRKKR